MVEFLVDLIQPFNCDVIHVTIRWILTVL
jgi:hypothetical protein